MNLNIQKSPYMWGVCVYVCIYVRMSLYLHLRSLMYVCVCKQVLLRMCLCGVVCGVCVYMCVYDG